MNKEAVNILLRSKSEIQRIVDELNHIRKSENTLSYIALELCNLYCACEITLRALDEVYASTNDGYKNVVVGYLKDSIESSRLAISTHMYSSSAADKDAVIAGVEFGLEHMEGLKTLVTSLYTIDEEKVYMGKALIE